ncbi:MAG: AIR synthase related protein [Cyanobium sp.]
MSDRILLAHGGGGSLTQQLIRQELLPLYGRPEGEGQPLLYDAALLELPAAAGTLAFTCDGYVVQPLEFPGGDIGRLAVIGTANDLAMAAARPRHLSVSLILEEGLPLALLRRVVASMVAAAEQCGLRIATGDTKVVERGKADGLFISTSGVGTVEQAQPVLPAAIHPATSCW